MSSLSANAVRRDLEVRADNEEFLTQWLGERSSELDAALEAAWRSRHADATVAQYDYWFGRLRRWCEEPSRRHRDRDKPGFELRRLFPIGGASEAIMLRWIADELLGPEDPAVSEEWLVSRGPWSPATLSMVVAAVKARSADFQSHRWEPSEAAKGTLVGFRRRLRELYGADRQAQPLLADHVAAICAHVAATVSPTAARDRLVLELHAAGVDNGGIARLTVGSVVEPSRVSCADAVTNAELFATSGRVGLRSLVVPGRNRRGGNTDEPQLVTLVDHPLLASALDAWLSVRSTVAEAGDVGLLALKSNPAAHLRTCLTRLAELAEIGWRPARGCWASPVDVSLMRSVLDAGVDWGGQLRRRRDQVMVLVGFLCALRRSELCGLRVRDVVFDGDDRAVVTIVKSKTDQEYKGARVLMRSRPDQPAAIRSVPLLAQWVATLRELGADADGVLFPSLDRHGAFKVRAGGSGPNPVGGQEWSERLRELAVGARVFGDDVDDVRYECVSGHSLRRGFVTQAILRGQDAVTISKHTRHRNVQMIATYADEVLALEADWQSHLFGGSDLLVDDVTAA